MDKNLPLLRCMVACGDKGQQETPATIWDLHDDTYRQAFAVVAHAEPCRTVAHTSTSAVRVSPLLNLLLHPNHNVHHPLPSPLVVFPCSTGCVHPSAHRYTCRLTTGVCPKRNGANELRQGLPSQDRQGVLCALGPSQCPRISA